MNTYLDQFKFCLLHVASPTTIPRREDVCFRVLGFFTTQEEGTKHANEVVLPRFPLFTTILCETRLWNIIALGSESDSASAIQSIMNHTVASNANVCKVITETKGYLPKREPLLSVIQATDGLATERETELEQKLKSDLEQKLKSDLEQKLKTNLETIREEKDESGESKSSNSGDECDKTYEQCCSLDEALEDAKTKRVVSELELLKVPSEPELEENSDYEESIDLSTGECHENKNVQVRKKLEFVPKQTEPSDFDSKECDSLGQQELVDQFDQKESKEEELETKKESRQIPLVEVECLVDERYPYELQLPNQNFTVCGVLAHPSSGATMVSLFAPVNTYGETREIAHQVRESSDKLCFHLHDIEMYKWVSRTSIQLSSHWM